MDGFDVDVGQRADSGGGWLGGGVGSLDVDVSDVADVDMRGEDVDGRDVEVLNDELNLSVLILGPK